MICELTEPGKGALRLQRSGCQPRRVEVNEPRQHDVRDPTQVSTLPYSRFRRSKTVLFTIPRRSSLSTRTVRPRRQTAHWYIARPVFSRSRRCRRPPTTTSSSSMKRGSGIPKVCRAHFCSGLAIFASSDYPSLVQRAMWPRDSFMLLDRQCAAAPSSTHCRLWEDVMRGGGGWVPEICMRTMGQEAKCFGSPQLEVRRHWRPRS